MNEIRPTSQQTDREKLSQDIERLKLAVKDTSLNRTWDEYSDSDDDALHITEDQNSRDANNDGQHGERAGVMERFFPEEAVQGISQDSIGSLGSVELTNSPEVCLALNREYQDWIKKNLTSIQIVLEHNRQCQREVRLEMQEKSSEKMALNAKRKTLTVYAKPYFKTADGSFPPPNEDSMIKRNSLELDPFIRPPKTWTTSERNRLRAAVQADRLQKALRPFMNKKEFELDRMKMVTPDSEEEKQIQEKLEDIDGKMKAIRMSTEINVMYGDLKDLESIDWMKIANVDFEGQRTPEACKLFWLNAAHPSITVLKWTPTEDAKLIDLVSRFEGVHWMEIAKCLGTSRSAFMCLQRYQTKLNPCLQTGKWTPDEDEFLKEVINNYKSGDSIPWSTVAYYVEGRSREQCARRWEQLHPKSFKKGKWTSEEDNKLVEAAKLFGVNKWWQIKEFVPGRTAAQCRERWKNTLDHNIHFGEWRYEEDRTLWLIVQELGAGHWQKIAKEYLPGRTDNMCLQRYRRLMHWYQENKTKERVKRQSRAGGWRPSKRWKRLTDKQYLKRKQLEKVLDRVKTEAKQKAILSAFKCVEGVCDDGQAGGDDGRSERTAEQISDLEGHVVTESGDCLYSPNEIEEMRQDQELGIFIPRPPTRSCVNRHCLPELHRFQMRSDIGRRVQRQLLSERRAPSNIRTRLEELISGKGTTGFSQPLQEKLRSLSDNSTIRELIELSAEVKQEVNSNLGSASGQQRGRPKRSEEEADVERKISMLACDSLMGARGFNRHVKFLGEDSSRTALKSTRKNSENMRRKVVHLMTNALGFCKSPPVVPSTPVPPSAASPVSSDATPQTTPTQPSPATPRGSDKQDAKAVSLLSPERSVVVVLKTVLPPSQSVSTANKPSQHMPQGEGVTPESPSCASSDPRLTKPSQHMPQGEGITPESPSCAASDPRLTPSTLKKAAYGRAALGRAQAKIYSMPPLPPSCSTLNAFKTLLLNRTKLLSVAGKFHIPGILPVPKSMMQTSQPTLKTEDKSLDMTTSPSGAETKVSDDAEVLEREGERKEMGTHENSPVAETEFRGVKSPTDNGIRNNDGLENTGQSTKGSPCLTNRNRSWADCHKNPRRLSRTVDKGSKHNQLQVVKSKLRSRRVLAAIQASHDYHLLRSRFLSLFLWPAFMSTLPVEEVKQDSSVEVTWGAEAEDAVSLLSTEEREHDYFVEECSSDDDDDWSKKHYKKRYAVPGKPRVYGRWKRREERNVAEETVLQGTSKGTSVVPSRGPGTFSHTDDSSSQVSQSESQKKKRVHRKRVLLLDDCRKSRRLAEKRDLKQRLEDQESVLALERHRALLKATDREYDSESSAPRKKRPRIMPDKSDTEQKSVGMELWESGHVSAQNKAGESSASIYTSSECHVQMSEFVRPSDLCSSSAGPADNKSVLINSNAFLQPAFLDASGLLQRFLVGPDGILHPVVVNSGQFLGSSAVDSDSFLRPPLAQSDPVCFPSIVNSRHFIQPVAMNLDELSGSSRNSLCPADMNGAGDDAQSSARKLESFRVLSSSEEDNMACSSSQLSFGFDPASVPVNFTAAKSSLAQEQKCDRSVAQITDDSVQVLYDPSSGDPMDCSDLTAVIETQQHDSSAELDSVGGDTASGSLDQSCEENNEIQLNYKKNELDKEAADQEMVQDSGLFISTEELEDAKRTKPVMLSNLDVLVEASELMEKTSTDARSEADCDALCVSAVEQKSPSTVLPSCSDPSNADQVMLEGCTSAASSAGGTDCVVFVTGFAETGLAETGLDETGLAETGLAETGLAETGLSTLSRGQKADGNPVSHLNGQSECTFSPTQYSCSSGESACQSKKYGQSEDTVSHLPISPTQHSDSLDDTACHSKKYFSMDESTGSVTSSDVRSCITVCDGLVARADETNTSAVASLVLVKCSSGHVDCGISSDTVSAEGDTGKQNAEDECSNPIAGQMELLAEPRPGSVIAHEAMDWTEIATTMTAASSESLHLSVSSVEIQSTSDVENDSNTNQELNGINDLAVQMFCDENKSQTGSNATECVSLKTSNSTSSVDNMCFANSEHSSDLLTQVPFANSSSSPSSGSSASSSSSSSSLSSGTPQVMMPNVLPLVSSLPSVLETATAAAVQKLLTLIVTQLLESLQMQLQQSQLLGAQNSIFPLVSTLLQSAGLPSSAGLQALAGLQQPAILQHPVALQQPVDLQSSAAFQSHVLQPPVGINGAGIPCDWPSSSGLHPNSALRLCSGLQQSSYIQLGANLQPAVGLQHGAMTQTADDLQHSDTTEMGSNLPASGSMLSESGMQFSTDSHLDNVLSDEILPAESNLQVNLSQSVSSTVSKNPTSPQRLLQTVAGNLSGSPTLPWNLPGTQPSLHTLPGNLPGSQPLLHTLPGNLPGLQPLLHTLSGNLSGIYPLLHTAPGNLPGSQPMSGSLSSSQPFQTVPGNFPGSQPLLETPPGHLSSSQHLLQTLPGNFPGSPQPIFQSVPGNPSPDNSASAAAQTSTSLNSQQLHELISMMPYQSSAAIPPTASLYQQLLSCLAAQLSGQLQQPVSANTVTANSLQMTAQILGPYAAGSVLQQIHSEPPPAYMMAMLPTNQAGSLIYPAAAIHGYLPSFMGLQTMTSCPNALPVVSASSFTSARSSSTTDQQPSAPTAASNTPELYK